MRLPPEKTIHSAVRPTVVRLRGGEGEGKGVGAYLVEDTADEPVVRQDGVYKILGRVGEL